MELMVTGCGFHVYLAGHPEHNCTLTCPGETFPQIHWVDCNGIGCCRLVIDGTNTMQLQFVRHTNGSSLKYTTIDLTTRHMFLGWGVHADHTPCNEELSHDNNYACVSKNSECGQLMENMYWYKCTCGSYYIGNPYILDGCSHVDSGNFNYFYFCRFLFFYFSVSISHSPVGTDREISVPNSERLSPYFFYLIIDDAVNYLAIDSILQSHSSEGEL